VDFHLDFSSHRFEFNCPDFDVCLSLFSWRRNGPRFSLSKGYKSTCLQYANEEIF
jgi:hypothetical protein